MSEKTMEIEKKEAELPVGVERTRPQRTYTPNVDIYEDADNVVLMADMPGASEDLIDITLEKNVLTIRAEIRWTDEDRYELAYSEFQPGDYERRFVLSDKVDQENIQATLKHGVLRLVLPKAAAVKARKITIQAEP